MPTTTNVEQVKLNIMTQAQYAQATKNPTELYFVTDASYNITVDNALSPTSTNPVQNKVIYDVIGDIETTINTIRGV